MRKQRKGPRRLAILLFGTMIFALTACGQKENGITREKVEGLEELGEITVVSREEGSGTRSTFAELVDFAGDSEDGQSSDRTKDDAMIVEASEEVVDTVKADTAAIGYVSEGALLGINDVKQLTVAGVAAGENDNKYPLSRSFYLTWNGKLREVEREFLTYIKGAGQDIVGDSYVAVAKSGSFLSTKPKGTVKIEGSTSVGPLLEQLAAEYMEYNPKASIVITQTDTTSGLNRVMEGKCDMAMASRELKDYEQELLDYEIIARDEIAVIVNIQNPLQDITMDELKRIYVGDVDSWQQLNE